MDIKNYRRQYYIRNKQTICQQAKEYLSKLKTIAHNLLGNSCTSCGISDVRVLQIDHINGGGYSERKRVTGITSRYKLVIESVQRGENKYQLLCANCNWIKKYDENQVKIS